MNNIDKYSIHNDKEIRGFFKEYRWLSNFHVCPVFFEGLLFGSSEAAYMAAKTEDIEIRKKFLNIEPKQARKLGQHIILRPDWEYLKYHYMYIVNLEKYTRSEDLKIKLLETKEKYLEEFNWWGDVEWGVSDKSGFLKGKNFLGRILMDIRRKLVSY